MLDSSAPMLKIGEMQRLLMRSKSFLVGNRLNLCLAVASVLVSLVFAEITFRVYLSRVVARSDYDHLDFSVQDKPYSVFDQQLGFRYKPNISVDWCSIKDSLPNLTGTTVFDSRGNSGPEVDDANCEVRIAVAGDSFTMIQHSGITWPYLLQQILRERTGRKVAVYNYARDGYGILQMIDQASSLVDEKPDIILISFITPDLLRDRFWRMENQTPRGVDVFTSTTPSLQIDKPETYSRTTLVDPRATRKWAEKTRAHKDRNDPVLRSLLDTYLREKNNYYITRFDPLSRRELYVWEWLTHSRLRPGGTANSEFTFDNFAADDRFMEGVAKLKQSRIPIYLVHLPYFPDLESGEYTMSDQDSRLLSSLKIITGFPLVKLLPAAPMGPDAKKMILSLDDAHPSLPGLEYYAQSIAQALANDSTIGKSRMPPGASARQPVPE